MGQAAGVSLSCLGYASWSTQGVSHSVFAIDGMRCAACSRSVTRAVEALAGIERVSVNVATGRAAVDWDPRRVTLRNILEAVSQAGFRPIALGGESAGCAQRTERRLALKRIGLAGLGMMQTMMFVYCLYAAGSHGIDPGIAQYLKLAGLLIATPVLVYSGAPFFTGARRDLRRLSAGMDVPVALALVVAYTASVINTLRGVGEIYFDSVTMFIFFLSAGRFVEMTVRQRNLSATEALARTVPSTVTRVAADGSNERIAPEGIRCGDLLSIPKGAVIPVDSRLVEGGTVVDESLLTGESLAMTKRVGEALLGGSINVGQPIRVIARSRSSDSMLASIVALLERTQAGRASIVGTADRLASWFALLTLSLAALAAAFWLLVDPTRALGAALAVLVVTCPCALSLATPAAMAAATARLARVGLLVTRADALERLARVDVVVVDKTGTLTSGRPSVEVKQVEGEYSREAVLGIAAALESASEHPIAVAFRASANRAVQAEALKEFPGRGVEGRIDGAVWRLGARRFVLELVGSSSEDEGSGIYLGTAQGIVASFTITDGLRSDVAHAVEQLRGMGLQVVIASGDEQDRVDGVARQLGIREALGRLTPQQKLAFVQLRQSSGANVLMVGDGINDGPVLAAAAVSCAMARGSAIAQAAADLLLLNESLATLAEAIRAARQMRSVIRQNLVWGLAYNLAAVPLAAMGWIAPWVAAIGMSGSSLLVVLNAARLARARRAAP